MREPISLFFEQVQCIVIIYLVGVEVVGVLVEWQPTNTGMLDSEVDFIILLGRGVMYDFDRTLHHGLFTM